MKDSIEILGDIISPATDEDEWEAFRDEARAAGPDRVIRQVRDKNSKR